MYFKDLKGAALFFYSRCKGKERTGKLSEFLASIRRSCKKACVQVIGGEYFKSIYHLAVLEHSTYDKYSYKYKETIKGYNT